MNMLPLSLVLSLMVSVILPTEIFVTWMSFLLLEAKNNFVQAYYMQFGWQYTFNIYTWLYLKKKNGPELTGKLIILHKINVL